ncbi:MAG: triple tyrosine motif-containing protein [Saprospiraceae bacterium]|nr:triple tyrosine motif-containing protein [Saprospiraceae bacterium]
MRYRPKIYYIILLVIFLRIIPEAYSQAVNIGIPPMWNFSNKTYKAGTQNWDADQDSRGVMFWANNEGLLRYDGTNWVCLPVANHTIVRSVAIDSSDKIYVGAQGELGYFLPGQNGCHTYHSLVDLLPEDQRAFEDVWDIVIYGQDVFFRTNHVIFQYSGGKMIIHKLDGSLLSMFVIGEGLSVQTVTYELLIFKNDSFQPFLKLAGLQSAITGALPWEGDTVILSTLKQGLFYLANGTTGRWTTLYDHLLKERRIYSSTTLPNGNLALGTSLDGLIVIDRQRRVIQHLNKKSGLQNNNILHTFSDLAGNVWLGLDNGIDCVVLDSRYTSIFPDGEMQATGYSASVFENQLYLGVSNGAYVAPWKSYYDPELGPVFEKVSRSDGQVWSLSPSGGELVMGHHEGSFILNANHSKLLSAEPGAWTFVTMSTEYMLGGTYTGLVLYHKEAGQWVFDKKLEGLKESCRIMVMDEDLSIWISHPYRGVYNVRWNAENKYHLEIRFFNQENGLPTNLNNYVFQIAGKAVFATEKGVFHFDRSKDKFVPADDFNRILGTQHRVRYLKEDTKGNVWYITDHEAGMLIVNDFGLKKEVHKKVIPELAGKLVGGFEFILPLDEHNIIIGTEQGFLHYSGDLESQSDTLLQIILSNITANGTGDSLLFGGFHPGTNLQSPQNAPTLQAGMNNLSFSFSTTEYKSPALVEYKTQLQGLDDEWSPWSSETKKSYTNLGPGKYTFHVQARIKDGHQSQVVSFSFRIRPPWYRSNPALTIYGLGFIGFFLGFILRQRQKFETEKAQMTETHQQKEAAHLRAVEQSKAELMDIQNEKLEAEITYKNQELALTTMHLVQKAEILLTVQEGLNKVLRKSSDQMAKKEVQQMVNLLNFDVKLDEDWEHFALHFDQVHVNFLKHLRERFPQLSANDYKLCAYLRMNLSTKEIAPLLNISVRGVEGSRYRLRRKLNLPNDANLTEFILQLPSLSSPK